MAVSLILFPVLFGMSIEYLENLENLLRALLVIIIGIIVSILGEQISKTKELTKAYNDIMFYRDLISHDMNNILQNISSSTELYSIFKKNGKNDNELDELIKIIRDQSFRGIRLTSNIQKLAKLEESKIYLKIINAKKVLKDAIISTKTGFQEREIIISIDAPDKTIWVKADDLLIEVFVNLLVNAVMYNDNPCVEIKVKISNIQIKETDYLKIEIKDNGIGILDERKETIFKRRFNKDKYSKGMGFGLSLVKKIINIYNGKVWGEDKVAGDYTKGSNFVTLIPQVFE